MTHKPMAVVVAMDRARGIGKDADLPWRLPGDMAHFRRLTSEAPEGMQNAVVMGRKTFESIPAKFRPLPGRLNLVLSRSANYQPEGCTRASSIEDAVAITDADERVASVFVIGGSSVYAAALAHPACATLHITQVDATLACDTFFPAFEAGYERIESSAVKQDGELCYTIDIHRRRGS